SPTRRRSSTPWPTSPCGPTWAGGWWWAPGPWSPRTPRWRTRSCWRGAGWSLEPRSAIRSWAPDPPSGPAPSWRLPSPRRGPGSPAGACPRAPGWEPAWSSSPDSDRGPALRGAALVRAPLVHVEAEAVDEVERHRQARRRAIPQVVPGHQRHRGPRWKSPRGPLGRVAVGRHDDVVPLALLAEEGPQGGERRTTG